VTTRLASYVPRFTHCSTQCHDGIHFGLLLHSSVRKALCANILDPMSAADRPLMVPVTGTTAAIHRLPKLHAMQGSALDTVSHMSALQEPTS
jgi:hypothetical protein